MADRRDFWILLLALGLVGCPAGDDDDTVDDDDSGDDDDATGDDDDTPDPARLEGTLRFTRSVYSYDATSETEDTCVSTWELVGDESLEPCDDCTWMFDVETTPQESGCSEPPEDETFGAAVYGDDARLVFWDDYEGLGIPFLAGATAGPVGGEDDLALLAYFGNEEFTAGSTLTVDGRDLAWRTPLYAPLETTGAAWMFNCPEPPDGTFAIAGAPAVGTSISSDHTCLVQRMDRYTFSADVGTTVSLSVDLAAGSTYFIPYIYVNEPDGCTGGTFARNIPCTGYEEEGNKCPSGTFTVGSSGVHEILVVDQGGCSRGDAVSYTLTTSTDTLQLVGDNENEYETAVYTVPVVTFEGTLPASIERE